MPRGLVTERRSGPEPVIRQTIFTCSATLTGMGVVVMISPYSIAACPVPRISASALIGDTGWHPAAPSGSFELALVEVFGDAEGVSIERRVEVACSEAWPLAEHPARTIAEATTNSGRAPGGGRMIFSMSPLWTAANVRNAIQLRQPQPRPIRRSLAPLSPNRALCARGADHGRWRGRPGWMKIAAAAAW